MHVTKGQMHRQTTETNMPRQLQEVRGRKEDGEKHIPTFYFSHSKNIKSIVLVKRNQRYTVKPSPFTLRVFTESTFYSFNEFVTLCYIYAMIKINFATFLVW